MQVKRAVKQGPEGASQNSITELVRSVDKASGDEAEEEEDDSSEDDDGDDDQDEEDQEDGDEEEEEEESDSDSGEESDESEGEEEQPKPKKRAAKSAAAKAQSAAVPSGNSKVTKTPRAGQCILCSTTLKVSPVASKPNGTTLCPLSSRPWHTSLSEPQAMLSSTGASLSGLIFGPTLSQPSSAWGQSFGRSSRTVNWKRTASTFTAWRNGCRTKREPPPKLADLPVSGQYNAYRLDTASHSAVRSLTDMDLFRSSGPGSRRPICRTVGS